MKSTAGSFTGTGLPARQDPFEKRSERFIGFPLRMLWCNRLHAIERNEKLEVHRLLSPERAVVVESGNAARRPDKAGPSVLGHRCDKFDQGLFSRSVVPRRKSADARAIFALKTTAMTTTPPL